MNYDHETATNMNNSIVVSAAIDNLKKVDLKYYESTFNQRLASNGAGSIVDGVNSIIQLEDLLHSSTWEEYFHPAISQGCRGYVASISGKLGVVNLEELPSDWEGVLDDRKGTGKASFCIEGINRIPVGYTVLIVGPETFEGEEVEIMYTFHPGSPVSPSTVSSEMCYYFGEPFPLLDGKKITVREAKLLGLRYGKIV